MHRPDGGENFLYRARLGKANLEKRRAAGVQPFRKLCRDTAVEVEAVRTAVEGKRRLAPDLPLERGHIPFRQVGRVGDDEVISTGNRFEQIAQMVVHRRAQPPRVFAGHLERVRADVRSGDGGIRVFELHRNRQNAAAGAKVQRAHATLQP